MNKSVRCGEEYTMQSYIILEGGPNNGMLLKNDRGFRISPQMDEYEHSDDMEVIKSDDRTIIIAKYIGE